MSYLWFGNRSTYSANVCMVPVVLNPNSNSFTVQAILDTGAYTSFFDKALAGALGFPDITLGHRVPATIANGKQAYGYQFAVDVKVLGRELTVPIAFCPDFEDGSPNLLGMEGFFDQVRAIAFDHSQKLLYY